METKQVLIYAGLAVVALLVLRALFSGGGSSAPYSVSLGGPAGGADTKSQASLLSKLVDYQTRTAELDNALSIARVQADSALNIAATNATAAANAATLQAGTQSAALTAQQQALAAANAQRLAEIKAQNDAINSARNAQIWGSVIGKGISILPSIFGDGGYSGYGGGWTTPPFVGGW